MWKSETRVRIVSIGILILIVLLAVGLMAVQQNSDRLADDMSGTLHAEATNSRLALTTSP